MQILEQFKWYRRKRGGLWWRLEDKRWVQPNVTTFSQVAEVTETEEYNRMRIYPRPDGWQGRDAPFVYVGKYEDETKGGKVM